MRRSSVYLVLVALLMGSCPAPVVRHSHGELFLARGDDASDELIRRTLRRSGFPRLRATLIEQIGERRQVEFLPELVHLLSDDNEKVREAAARAIYAFGWERMSGPMLRILRRKTTPFYTRELACRTLVRTGRREVVEPLIELLNEPRLRPSATAGLRVLTFQDLSTPDEWRRWWRVNRNRTRAEWVAGREKDLRRRMKELERKLEASRRRVEELEKEPAVSRGQIERLRTELEASRKRCLALEERTAEAVIRSLESRVNKKDPSPLIDALGEDFVRVRKYAASELGKLKAKEAVKRLSEMVGGENDTAVRVEYAAALGQIGAPEAVPVLAGLLGDSNSEIAAAAARALGRLKADSAVNRLLLALLSRSPVVRGAATEALGQIGSAVAVVPLAELLGSDREAGVRERAARALGEIGDKRARAMLERALKDESPAVRVYAVEALGALKTPEDAGRLCAVLEKDRNPSVREAAAVALGKLGTGESLPVLMRVLEDPQEKLTQLAASSIIAICRREEGLLEPTADGLVAAGHVAHAVTLYELLAQKLAEKKDDKGLISVRVKLADGYVAVRQWTKATPLLEALTGTLPDDVGLAEKHARALTELRRHAEALRVYGKLAARKESGGYWSERLVLLEAMLKDGKAAEVSTLVNGLLKGEVDVSDDVRTGLESLRRRSATTLEE